MIGLNTNIQFLMDLSKHAEFEAGNVHTDFISQHGEQLFPEKVLSPSSLCQAAIALVLRDRETSKISYRNSLGLYMTEFIMLQKC